MGKSSTNGNWSIAKFDSQSESSMRFICFDLQPRFHRNQTLRCLIILIMAILKLWKVMKGGGSSWTTWTCSIKLVSQNAHSMWSLGHHFGGKWLMWKGWDTPGPWIFNFSTAKKMQTEFSAILRCCLFSSHQFAPFVHWRPKVHARPPLLWM